MNPTLLKSRLTALKKNRGIALDIAFFLLNGDLHMTDWPSRSVSSLPAIAGNLKFSDILGLQIQAFVSDAPLN